MNIIEEIGIAAAYEQLAEECAELSKAALKVSRILRDENPTPVTMQEAMQNLNEEVTDIQNCIQILVENDCITIDVMQAFKKLERWEQRIKERKDEKAFVFMMRELDSQQRAELFQLSNHIFTQEKQ